MSVKPRTIKTRFDGRSWTIYITGRIEPLVHGDTDHTKRRIRISRHLDADGLLEVALHEFIHAEFPFLDEERVETAGHNIAGALIRSGIFPPLPQPETRQ